MYNLQEFSKLYGKYQLVRTHLWNLPYGICKSKKNELEKFYSMGTNSFFKIVKV
jgi:hypothetical protein